MNAREALLTRIRERVERPPPLGAAPGDRELIEEAVARLPASGPITEVWQQAAREPKARSALIEASFGLLVGADSDLRGSSLLDASVWTLSPKSLDARELADRLPTIALDKGASDAARVGSMALLLAFDDGSVASLEFACTYVEQLLTSGKCKKAFRKAAKAYAKPNGKLPDAPATQGAKTLKGSRDLDFNPYCHRRTMQDVVGLLARAAAKDRKVVPWLFEGGKLWSTEGAVALRAVRDSAPSDDELRDGFAELVRYCAVKPSRDRAKLVRRALEVGGKEPRWLALLLLEVEQRKKLCDALAERLISVPQFAPAEDASGDPWRRRVGEIADGAKHPAVRAISFAAAGGSEATAAAVIETMPSDLVDVVTGRVIRARAFAPRIARAVDKALLAFEGRAKHRQDLVALAWNCRQQGKQLRADFLPGARVSPPWLADGELVAFYHRIRTMALPSNWANDEDEFGAIVLSDPLRLVPIPSPFPMLPNGANLAKRELQVECVLDGEVVLTLQCPFSRDRSWGTENFIWSFRPSEGWRSWVRMEGELAPAADGAQAESVSFGDLLLWRQGDRLRFAIDGTPYHLDDWTHTDDVKQALLARRQARESYTEQPKGKRRRKVRWSDLEVPRPSEDSELDTVWTGDLLGRKLALVNCRRQYRPEFAAVIVR